MIFLKLRGNEVVVIVGVFFARISFLIICWKFSIDILFFCK